MNSDKLKRELSQNEMLLAIVRNNINTFKRIKELSYGSEEMYEKLINAVINSYEALGIALENGDRGIQYLYSLRNENSKKLLFHDGNDIFLEENESSANEPTDKNLFESFNDGDEYFVISRNNGNILSKKFGEIRHEDYGYYMADNMFASYDEAEIRRQKLLDERSYGLYCTILDYWHEGRA